MPTTPSLPDGLRIYAVGDVHGRLDLLQDMAANIRHDLQATPAAQSLEIYLGDYVDRGPQSCQVVDWLMDAPPRADRRICLIGNHEEMFLDAVADSVSQETLSNWLFNGGDATLVSYGIDVLHASPTAQRAAFDEAIPERHTAFLRDLPRSIEFGSYLFVHAGINPERPLDDQDPQDLVWIREPFHSSTADFGRIVVHGHTPVEEPDIRPNRINIDTGAVFTGCLTCLVLEGQGHRLMQTETR